MLQKIFNSLFNTFTDYKKVDFSYSEIKNDYKGPKVLLGKIKSEQNRNRNISSLQEVEFQVFSQFGDDGIIQYLISKIPIPNKTFVEFGVENYRESNTRFLLINDYWSGMVIDGSTDNIAFIKNEQYYPFFDLQVESAFITSENINDLLLKSKFCDEIGILSIDIDGNDYWIWNSISRVKPVILICEYNSLFGFRDPFTIPYNSKFIRGQSCQFNFYGASLQSLSDLSSEKGYTFIGCNSAGNNSYFLRNDYLQYLGFEPPTLELGFIFSSFSEVWDIQRNALRGIEKLKSIHGLEVYNTVTNELQAVDSFAIAESLLKANKMTRS